MKEQEETEQNASIESTTSNGDKRQQDPFESSSPDNEGIIPTVGGGIHDNTPAVSEHANNDFIHAQQLNEIQIVATDNTVKPALPEVTVPAGDTISPQSTTLLGPLSQHSLRVISVHSNGDDTAPTLPTSMGTDGDLFNKIAAMETELSLARVQITSLQGQLSAAASLREKDTATLQSSLKQQINLTADAEGRAQVAEAKIRQLEQSATRHKEEVTRFDLLRKNLDQEMILRAELDNKARSAYNRVQELESDKERNLEELKSLQNQLVEAREAVSRQSTVLEKARWDRNDQEQRAMSLTTMLNSLKTKDSVKANVAEELEDDLKANVEELDNARRKLSLALSEKSTLMQKLSYTEQLLKERIDYHDMVVSREKKLNAERKLKLKAFVEAKAEELRQAKEENDSLQVEVSQSNRSLVELNTRWKQLHTQWVQAQTRNRELQRDLNRTKKDSENLHKQGDTLEMKLSRSANETEEHKNKRLAAKNELMSVLRTLDMERDVTSKLKDKIKFDFTPQLKRQHELLNECIEEFESSLQKLSLRLGKPIPSLPLDPDHETDDKNARVIIFSSCDGTAHAEAGLLVDKLEQESRRVGQAISDVVVNVERLQTLLRISGDRTCFTALSELVTTGTMVSSSATLENGQRATIATSLPSIGRSHRYGQVPGTTERI